MNVANNTNQPSRWYGSTEAITRSVALAADDRGHCRVGIWGDSLSSDVGFGAQYTFDLNRYAAERICIPTETPLMSASTNRLTVPGPHWLHSTVRDSISAVTSDFTSPEAPPGFGVVMSDSASFASLRGVYWTLTPTNSRAGGINTPWIRSETRFWNPDLSGTVAEVFGRGHVGGPPELQVTTGNVAVEQAVAVGAQFFNQQIEHSAGLNLDADEISVRKFTTSVIDTSTNQIPQIRATSSDGTTVAVGGFISGARFVDTLGDGGLSFTSFSVGGRRAAQIASNYQLCGPTIAATGPWSFFVLRYGTNDIGERNPEEFKADLIELINLLRGPTFLNTDIPIAIDVQPRRQGLSPQQTIDLRNYVLVSREIADEMTDVCVHDPNPYLESIGWFSNLAFWQSDNLHPGRPGQSLTAKYFINSLISLTE